MNTRVIIVLLLVAAGMRGQLAWPIDPPREITGNYGELRTNHFHAGIDFTTSNRIKRPVYAVKDGFVSRIRVSPYGYGKSVYITHPNGIVTVYGHLHSFSLPIAALVEAEQRKLGTTEIEILQRPGVLPVKEGEIIGLSGNSGGSTGPHLHFEVRDAKTETPLDPLEYLKMADTVRPEIQALALYDLCDTMRPRFAKSLLLRHTRGNISIVSDSRITGIAFSAIDRMKAAGNANNVHSIRLILDGRYVYGHTLRAIDFADNRFVNEFSEPAGRFRFQKCFAPTLFPPHVYDQLEKKGRVVFSDTLPHIVQLTAIDEAGNPSTVEFTLRWSGKACPPDSSHAGLFLDCRRDFVFRDESRIVIRARSTYYDGYLSVNDRLRSARSLEILPPMNLASAYEVAMLPGVDAAWREKLVLKSGNTYYPSTVRNDSVIFMPKAFGPLLVEVDSVPPLVRTYLTARKLRRVKRFSAFSFRITDSQSGIATYTMTVNGAWVPAEYDAKNDALNYEFDERTPQGPLDFSVVVTDRQGNRTNYRYRLKR